MVIMMITAQWPVERARTHTRQDYRIPRAHNGAHPAYPDCIFQCATIALDAVMRAAWIRQIKSTPRPFLLLAECFINSIRCARESDRTAGLLICTSAPFEKVQQREQRCISATYTTKATLRLFSLHLAGGAGLFFDVVEFHFWCIFCTFSANAN